MRYPSPILFHGPGAGGAAKAKVPHLGRLLHAPFGENGLKIAESREIVELMNSASVGDAPGVLIIGPLDRATAASQDVLLKNLEEFDDQIIRPILWALDEADVRATIRSRCIRQWCPGPDNHDEEIMYQARAVVGCALSRDIAGVIEAINEQDPRLILEATTRVLAERGIGEDTMILWEKMRHALKFDTPTPNEVLTVFL